MDGSSLTLRNTSIRYNFAIDGSGIEAVNSSVHVLQNSSISDNIAFDAGGGVRAYLRFERGVHTGSSMSDRSSCE